MTNDIYRKFLRSVDHIKDLIKLKAPEPILAGAISNLFWLGVSYLEKDMIDEFFRPMLEKARQMRAVCARCESPIPILRSYAPECDSCNAKGTKEYLQMNIDMEAYFPEDSKDE